MPRSHWCVHYKRSRAGMNSRGTSYLYWETRCLGVAATTIWEAIEAVRRIPAVEVDSERVGGQVVILTASHRGVIDLEVYPEADI